MTTVQGALDPAARLAIAQQTERIFRDSGALQEGHFLLSSGRHGMHYVEKFQVLQWPGAVSELCRHIAARARKSSGESLVDVVCGPTTGGVIIAFEVARQLGVRGIFAEEVRTAGGAGARVLRRGFRLERGERVLIVDDILTTGGSLLQMLPPVEAAGATIELVSVLVDRSSGFGELTSPASGRAYPLEALWSLALPTYAPGAASCPGCEDAVPLEVPGGGGGAAPA